jgi:hypothetical protein
MTIRMISLSFDAADANSGVIRATIAAAGQALERNASDPGPLNVEGMAIEPTPKALSADVPQQMRLPAE